MSRSDTAYITERRKSLGTSIREARKAAGFDSMEAFAYAIGVSWITVSRWERGVSEISLDRLEQIASALGTSVEQLVSDRRAA